MKSKIYLRTQALIGEERLDKIRSSRVAVFGIGGVGGHAAEAIARAGVGRVTLVDGDVVSESNLNRQLVALRSTIGINKARAMADRIADIDPNIEVTVIDSFFAPETEFDFAGYDYIIDAIDQMEAKLSLICRAHMAGVPIVSATGAGNKLYPERFCVTDIMQTDTDPLARRLRRELRLRGVDLHKVVWSAEQPVTKGIDENGKRVPASISFVPGAMGMILAAQCLRDIMGESHAE